MIDVVSFPTKILYGEDKEGRKSFYFLMEDFSGAYNLLEIYADKKGHIEYIDVDPFIYDKNDIDENDYKHVKALKLTN